MALIPEGGDFGQSTPFGFNLPAAGKAALGLGSLGLLAGLFGRKKREPNIDELLDEQRRNLSQVFGLAREQIPIEAQEAFAPLRRAATERLRGIGGLGSPSQEQALGQLDVEQIRQIARALAQLKAQELGSQNELLGQRLSGRLGSIQSQLAQQRARRQGIGTGAGAGLGFLAGGPVGAFVGSQVGGPALESLFDIFS